MPKRTWGQVMDAGIQRTAILALCILALATLAGVGMLSGHDPNGAIFYMVTAGLLGIAGTAAGAHAANGQARPTGDTSKDPAS